nr:hypothetical protein CFP56_08113 [Quercus suber]
MLLLQRSSLDLKTSIPNSRRAVFCNSCDLSGYKNPFFEPKKLLGFASRCRGPAQHQPACTVEIAAFQMMLQVEPRQRRLVEESGALHKSVPKHLRRLIRIATGNTVKNLTLPAREQRTQHIDSVDPCRRLHIPTLQVAGVRMNQGEDHDLQDEQRNANDQSYAASGLGVGENPKPDRAGGQAADNEGHGRRKGIFVERLRLGMRPQDIVRILRQEQQLLAILSRGPRHSCFMSGGQVAKGLESIEAHERHNHLVPLLPRSRLPIPQQQSLAVTAHTAAIIVSMLLQFHDLVCAVV